MTKILEEIGAESGAGGDKGRGEENRFRIRIKRRSRSMRTIYVCTIASIWNIARILGRRDASYSGFIRSMWPDKPTLNVDL